VSVCLSVHVLLLYDTIISMSDQPYNKPALVSSTGPAYSKSVPIGTIINVYGHDGSFNQPATTVAVNAPPRCLQNGIINPTNDQIFKTCGPYAAFAPVAGVAKPIPAGYGCPCTGTPSNVCKTSAGTYSADVTAGSLSRTLGNAAATVSCSDAAELVAYLTTHPCVALLHHTSC
jgi:hypothetical protein